MYVKIQSINGNDVLVNTDDIAVIQKTKSGCAFTFRNDNYIYDTLCHFDELVEVVTKDKETKILIEQGEKKK